MNRFLLCLILGLLSIQVSAKTIHKERSIYRNVEVVEEGELRCMQFESRRSDISYQACIDLYNPQRLVFEYVQGMLAGYALMPRPKRVLIIGLGGGTLSNLLHQISPQAEIISVDIDPLVVKLARRYFNYQENDKVKTVVKDGRVFIKRAQLNNEKFDWIILDAFNGDYIPEHLMTQEFLFEAKSRLRKNGIISANTFSGSRLYDYESATYQSVFNNLQIYKSPTKGNRIIFGCNCEGLNSFPKIPSWLEKAVTPYNLDLKKIWRQISGEVDWDRQSPVLTDQYSPANLLN